MRRSSLAVLIAAAGILAVGCSDSVSPAPPEDVASSHPVLGMRPAVVVDGHMKAIEWSDAAFLVFRMNAPERLLPAVLLAKSDATNLYLAVWIPRPALGDAAEGFVMFDTDGGGNPLDLNEDVFSYIGFPRRAGIFHDMHWEATPSGGRHSVHDTDIPGGTSDGSAAVGSDGVSTFVEMSHPLNSGDSYDISITEANPEAGLSVETSLPLHGWAISPVMGLSTTTQVPGGVHVCKIKVIPEVFFMGCPAGQVASVRILPSVTPTALAPTTPVEPVTLPVGASRQLGLALYDYLGTDVTSLAQCTWEVIPDDESVIRLEGPGLVRAVAEGEGVVSVGCQATGGIDRVWGDLKVTVFAIKEVP